MREMALPLRGREVNEKVFNSLATPDDRERDLENQVGKEYSFLKVLQNDAMWAYPSA